MDYHIFDDREAAERREMYEDNVREIGRLRGLLAAAREALLGISKCERYPDIVAANALRRSDPADATPVVVETGERE